MPDPGVHPSAGGSPGFGGGSAPSIRTKPSEQEPSGNPFGVNFEGGGSDDDSGSPRGSRAWYEENFGGMDDPEDFIPTWQDMVTDYLPKDLGAWAKKIGEDPRFATSWLQSVMPQLLYDVGNQWGRLAGNGAVRPDWDRTSEGLQ